MKLFYKNNKLQNNKKRKYTEIYKMNKIYYKVIPIYIIGVLYILFILNFIFNSNNEKCNNINLSEVYRHISNKEV